MIYPSKSEYRWGFDPFETFPWGFNDLLGFVPRSAQYPAVNLSGNDEALELTAEVAGFAPEEISVSVKGNVLTLEGERKAEQLDEGKTYQRQERVAGDFSRSLKLPYDIESDHVKARIENGVLRLTLPRLEATKPRRIAIEVV
jgi:HSP20 family protein